MLVFMIYEGNLAALLNKCQVRANNCHSCVRYPIIILVPINLSYPDNLCIVCNGYIVALSLCLRYHLLLIIIKFLRNTNTYYNLVN